MTSPSRRPDDPRSSRKNDPTMKSVANSSPPMMTQPIVTQKRPTTRPLKNPSRTIAAIHSGIQATIQLTKGATNAGGDAAAKSQVDPEERGRAESDPERVVVRAVARFDHEDHDGHHDRPDDHRRRDVATGPVPHLDEHRAHANNLVKVPRRHHFFDGTLHP